MSNGKIRPSTLVGLKKYARSLKTSQGVTHARGLDLAAQAAGFHNYTHALRNLEGAAPASPAHSTYISVPWRDRETKATGREILAIDLQTPLEALVKPGYLKAVRYLAGFRIAAADHLEHDLTAGSLSDARRRACAAARTFAFMQATGLRPSAGRSRAYPKGDFTRAMPGMDHSSEWFDPTTKAYVLVDEPYADPSRPIPEERLAWAERYGWAITRPSWAGMYNPDGGCLLYLAADPTKGFDLNAACAALNALPAPFVEADWNGKSARLMPPFFSPMAKAALATPCAPPKPRAPRSPGATFGFRTVLSPRERRRPAKRMPLAGHMEIGRLLKAVIYPNRLRRSVYAPLDHVRAELDDWVQCEYDRVELPNAIFFDLYYHEDQAPDDAASGPALTAQQLERLATARRLLTEHYLDCAPLRGLLKAIDRASAALQA